MASPLSEFNHLLIPLKEILEATNNFADKNLIGSGAFGKVYKGRLRWSERWIDICARRLDRRSGLGIVEFHTEISMLSSLHHENLVSIIGFCDEEHEKIIINTHEAKGSLELYLSGSILTWMLRLKICLGVARGLRYLHNSRVIHHNINSSTILLGHKWEAKLSGFEFSLKNTSNLKQKVLLTEVCGVLGYVDPIHEKTGGVTYKSDVFSFGMVLFEILCGRKTYIENDRNKFLAPLARMHYDEKKLENIVHPDLLKDMDRQSLHTFSWIAYTCLKGERLGRPAMDEIVHKLQELVFNLNWKHEHPEETRLGAQLRQTNFWKEKQLEHLRVPLKDIMKATKNFQKDNFFLHANYFDMYRGTLDVYAAMEWNNEGAVPKILTDVLIKRFNPTKLLNGGLGFFAEIGMLSSCKHRNIDPLLGYCDEGIEIITIHGYPSACLGNLFARRKNGLAGNPRGFPWKVRLKVCLTVAEALNYLHSETDDKPSVIHGNIKSYNIVFTHSDGPKITGFRLSIIDPRDAEDNNLYATYWEPMIKKSSLSRNGLSKPVDNNQYADDIECSRAYCDPEYFQSGTLTTKSDIYSFGVILFEFLHGNFAYATRDDHFKRFTSPERGCFDKETLKEIVDPNLWKAMDLNKDANIDSVVTFSNVAYQCLAKTAYKRPKIEYVINELEKALFVLDDHRISFKDIELATKEFSSDNQIGEGGYGKVYKGELQHANVCKTVVAKRLNRNSQQGNHQYLTELQILHKYRHENLIELVGYCDQGQENIIVYEYMSNGSLEEHLKNPSLTWQKRLEICLDIAKGLEFLHEGGASHEVVIHRDIKSSNILLNDVWGAKIADFGLSLITTINKERDSVVRYPCGTRAYIDPLYEASGLLTRESDIYSLGVVLLELLSGRLAYKKYNNEFLIMLAKRCLLEGKPDEMVFDDIKEQVSSSSLMIFTQVAFKCLLDERDYRATAGMVIEQLQLMLAPE